MLILHELEVRPDGVGDDEQLLCGKHVVATLRFCRSQAKQAVMEGAG